MIDGELFWTWIAKRSKLSLRIISRVQDGATAYKKYSPGQAPIELKDYERLGGYTALRKALGSMTPKEVVELVKSSNLRGRGEQVFLPGSNGSNAFGPDMLRPSI